MDFSLCESFSALLQRALFCPSLFLAWKDFSFLLSVCGRSVCLDAESVNCCNVSIIFPVSERKMWVVLCSCYIFMSSSVLCCSCQSADCKYSILFPTCSFFVSMLVDNKSRKHDLR